MITSRRRMLVSALVAVLVAIAGLTLNGPAAHAIEDDDGCRELLTYLGQSSDSSSSDQEQIEQCQEQLADDQQDGDSGGGTGQSTSNDQESNGAAGRGGGDGEGSAEPEVYGEYEAESAPQEWAVETGRSAHDLTPMLEKELEEDSSQFDPGMIAPYSVAWGIGIVMLAFVLVIMKGQAARGGPNRLYELQQAGVGALLFMPLSYMAPWLVYQLFAIAGSMGDWFSARFSEERGLVWDGISRSLAQPAGPVDLITGGVLSALFFSLVYVVAAWTLLIELILAKFGLYLLVCLFPPMAALALMPRFRPALIGLTGGMVGLLLTAPLLKFAMWVGFAFISDEQGRVATDTLTSRTELAVTTAVILFITCMAPLLMAFLAPRVFAMLDGGDSRQVRAGMGQAVGLGMSGMRTGSQLARSGGRGARQLGGSVFRGARAGGTVAGVGTGAKAGGVTGGPVGAVAGGVAGAAAGVAGGIGKIGRSLGQSLRGGRGKAADKTPTSTGGGGGDE